MWASFAERFLNVFVTILSSFLPYWKGRKDVKDSLKDEALSDAELSKKIDDTIAASRADPLERDKLREQWTRHTPRRG